MLATRLSVIRKKRGKTQQEVADFLGITRPAYTAYESGTRSPDSTALSNLADYFNTNVDYLLGRTDNSAPPDSEFNQQIDQLDPDVQFIARAKEELSPKAFQKMMELAKKAKEMFADEDDE